MRWNFAHILNKSLIRPISYENSLWSFVQVKRLWSSDIRPIGLRIYSKYGKIPMHHFRLLIYFWSYTWSLKCGQLQDWKIQVVCMEDSIGCKIGNFQTESNVIMLHKHSNKSVSESLFIFHQRIQNLSANIV